MKRRHLVLALALALGASVFLAIWLSLFSSSERTNGDSIAELSTRPDEEPAMGSLEERETLRSTAPSAEEATPEEPASGDIVLLGRCVDADAKPVPGVAFRLKRWYPRADRRENEVLAPMDLRTDADGRFEISVPHVRVLTLHLSLLDPRYAERQWRWQSLPPGSREDLGEITVALGATLRGRLLDFRGVPIREHWTVSLNAIQISERIEWVPSTSAEKSDTPSERFELVGLTAGKWKVTARYPSFELATAVVELAAGEVRELELRQEGTRDPWREIVVRADVPDLMPDPDPRHMNLLDSGGALRAAAPAEPNRSEIRFVDLEPGFYRLEIEDPRFERWSLDRVEPSPRVVEPELRGSSTLEFLVIDGSTRAPIEKYALELVMHGHPMPDGKSYSSRTDGNDDLEKARKQKPRPEGRTVLNGVCPGEFRFVLQAEGYRAQILELKNVAPSETRSEIVELHRGVAITGLVRRQGSAEPAPGVEVLLFRPALIDDGPDSLLLRANWRTGNEDSTRREVASVKTALDGSFRLEGVPPGRWVAIAVSLGPGEQLSSRVSLCPSCAVHEDIFVVADVAPEPIVLELPAAGSIFGRASLPENARRERVALQLFRAIESKTPLVTPNYAPQNWDAVLVGTTFLGASSDFRFENLIAGRYRLAVAFSSDPSEPDSLEDRVALRRTAFNLKELTLAEGAELRCDLDLAAFAPAEVRARLSAEGGELGTTTLTLQAAPDPTAGPPFDRRLQRARLDAQGSAVHSAVLPGRKLVFAIGGGGTWYHVFHRDLDVRGGSTHELSGTIELHAGEIEVERVPDRPMASVLLRLESGEPELKMYARGRTLRLDDRGRARLSLPAGTYALSTGERAGETTLTANFDWPAGDVVRVKLAAAR
ncbi:MAG: hypothetical protein JNM84_01475 [Planctomycetes bacterium]|nr:hypothetical protein [Planctomycetota bacterium]